MNLKTLILVVLTTSALLGPVAAAAPPANNEVIPLIEMDNVLLPDAIRTLARQAHMNIVLDPRLSEPPFSRYTVSIRWQNVTTRDALVALLDNYGLKLVEL